MEKKSLERWSGRQRARSRDNAQQVSAWVYRWGWTTNQIIGRLLDLKRPGLAEEFVERGVLQRIATPPGYREKYAYFLADRGMQLAHEALDEWHEYIKMVPYTIHESHRIPWSLHAHNCIAQHIILDRLGPRPNQMSFSSEPEFRSEEGDIDAVPDFSITTATAVEWCEIELNQKQELRLKKWLYLRAKALAESDDLKVVVYTPLNGVAAAIQRLINAPRLYEVRRNTAGKLIELRNRPPIEISARIRKKIEVQMLCRDPSKKTGGFKICDDDEFI